MKTILLTLLCVLPYWALGQARPYCILNATTNPNESPSYEQINSLPLSNGENDFRFINEWAWWMDPLNPNWPYNVTLNDMGLNPGESYGGVMEPINSSAYTDHYFYLNENYQEVMHPDGGWELLSFNRGWYPDNETSVNWSENSTIRSTPYLIFYNKFSGIARIFFRYGGNTHPNEAINFAEVKIRHLVVDEVYATGVMRLGNGRDQTLDQPTIINSLAARVPSPGSSVLWFSADFQMAYDPCVCEFDSKIRADFRFFSSSSIQLTGRAITATNQFTSEDFMFDADYIHDFFSSLDDSSEDSNKGNIIYKHMNFLIEDYLNRLKVYKAKLEDVNANNAEIDKLEAILKIAKVVVSLGVTAVTGMPEYTSLLSLLPSLKAKKDSQNFGKETQKAFWKALDKALGVGFDLLIKDDLKRKTAPQAPVMPSVSFTEMEFSGEISTSTPTMSTYPLRIPGSKNSNVINTNHPTEYPVYDEALGVFALLEKPKIIVSRTLDSENSCLEEYTWADDELCQKWTTVYQYKLLEDLKYALNPALNIEKVEMSASIQGNWSLDGSNVSDYLFNCYIDSNFTVNTVGAEISLEGSTPLRQSLLTNYYPCDCLPVDAEEVTLPSITTYSEYVPIDAFKNSYYSIGIQNRAFLHSPANVQPLPIFEPGLDFGWDVNAKFSLKIDLKIVFEGLNNQGEPNDFTYAFTYDIQPEDVTYQEEVLYPELSSSIADFTQFSENSLYENAVFDGDIVEGCELVGTHYLCKSWNDVELSGIISIGSGYTVDFEAGNEIVIQPDAVIPTTANLRIVSPFDFSHPMPPATANQVKAFCSGPEQKYEANELSASVIQEMEEMAALKKDVSLSEIFIDVYPNPTSSSSELRISVLEEEMSSVQMFDLNGRTIELGTNVFALTAGLNIIDLQTDELSAGVYIIRVNVGEQLEMFRLIKQ
jgi:hypothetical protein